MWQLYCWNLLLGDSCIVAIYCEVTVVFFQCTVRWQLYCCNVLWCDSCIVAIYCEVTVILLQCTVMWQLYWCKQLICDSCRLHNIVDNWHHASLWKLNSLLFSYKCKDQTFYTNVLHYTWFPGRINSTLNNYYKLY